jgi:nicotinamidase-related amidase
MILSRPALLVIDMQNDFVLEAAPMRVAAAAATVPVIVGLLSAFRAAGLPVGFTRYIATGRYTHLAGQLPWLRLLESPVNACRPGFLRSYPNLSEPRDGADMIDSLRPEPEEIVVDKPYFSAFHDTNLDQRLRHAGADSLVVTGTITEMCVEDTARHAVHFGWPVTILSDAVSSDNAQAASAMLSAFARNYGAVTTSRNILSRLADRG